MQNCPRQVPHAERCRRISMIPPDTVGAAGQRCPAGHPRHPRRQPQQGSKSQRQKKRTPSKTFDHRSSHQNAYRRSERKAGYQAKHWQSRGGSRGSAWRGFWNKQERRLTPPAQNYADSDKSGEAMQQAGHGGCDRPQEKACGKHPLHVEAIDQPSGGHLHQSVGPEKGCQQSAELRSEMRNSSFSRGGDREIAAIDVVDKDRKAKQEKHAVHPRSAWRLLSGRGSMAAMTVPNSEYIIGKATPRIVHLVGPDAGGQLRGGRLNAA